MAKTAEATTAFDAALIHAEPVYVKTCCAVGPLIATSLNVDSAGLGAAVHVRPVGPRARNCPELPVLPLIESRVVAVNATVPLRLGDVRVLFVNVSVVARPTNVSVAAGRVKVVVPATAVAKTVVVPDVDPAKIADVPNDRVVSTVAEPYILVPDKSFAIFTF